MTTTFLIRNCPGCRREVKPHYETWHRRADGATFASSACERCGRIFEPLRLPDPALAARLKLELSALVQAVYDDPGNRPALVDFLEENVGATPPLDETETPPDWLRRRWLRATEQPRWERHYHRRGTSCGNVFEEMCKAVERSAVFDHCGRTTVLGLRCWITEPYREVESLQELLLAAVPREVAVLAVCPTAFHYSGCSRAVFFDPPIPMPAARKARRQR